MIIKKPSCIRKIAVKLLTSVLFFPFADFRKTATKALMHNSLYNFVSVIFNTHFKQPQKFKYNLSVLACCKDEGDYIVEWVEYYMLQGVEHFYLYNNNGTDNSEQLLKPYIDKGIITWINWPGQQQQLDIYNNCIAQYKNDTKWLAIVDLDEFIVPMKEKKLTTILSNFDDVNQIVIPWVLYGSSGHRKKEDGLVIERFTKHQIGLNKLTKTILNPRSVFYADVHISVVYGRTVDEHKNKVRKTSDIKTSDILRINHYVIKSREEYENKKRRGDPYFKYSQFNEEFFKAHDLNDIDEPELMKGYAQQIKQNLQKGLR